jgi:DNA-binding MurR/RpiR family transcriptional regulator
MATGNAIRLKIKSFYPSLTPKEQEIARFILDNPSIASRMTITELSEKIGIADSTIFKFTKSLGYKGFRDFRNDLLTDAYDPEVSVHENVHQDDPVYTVASKVFDSSIKSLNDTKRLLDSKSLEHAIALLLKAKRVSFYGCGESNAVAYDAYQKFLRSPMRCQVTMDYHVQLMQASLMDEDDCSILVSHTGLTKETINLASIAHGAGSSIIAITSYPSEYLKKYADVILVSASDETGYRSESLSSRISQLVLIDSLYTALMFRLPDVRNSLHKIRSAISSTKIEDPSGIVQSS